jgi:hypothetical protein
VLRRQRRLFVECRERGVHLDVSIQVEEKTAARAWPLAKPAPERAASSRLALGALSAALLLARRVARNRDRAGP